MQPNDKKSPDPQRNLSSTARKTIEPSSNQGANSAADLIRQRLNALYADEDPTPAANNNDKQELNVEFKSVEDIKNRSKHQQFMYELSHSGKSLAEIQTQWHEYYLALPNDQKHEVWQEFYTSHDKQQAQRSSGAATTKSQPAAGASASTPQRSEDNRSINDIKQQLLGKVTARGKAKRSHHIQSLLFGLGMGSITLLIFLFGFFNERFIAPFVTPARAVSSTPIIIDPAGGTIGPESKIIIPKINVEIPIDFDEPTIDEAAIQRALEKGVVHYPTTPDPGQIGNGVIFGHSANNILNKGKYKFAFVLLKRLENGDVFYIQKDGKRYAYKTFDKKIVAPTEVSVLYPNYPDKPSTFTLITCDPPGTSLNRLVVVGEQISPDPAANVASSVTGHQQATPKELPSNSITLWQRIKNWL